MDAWMHGCMDAWGIGVMGGGVLEKKFLTDLILPPQAEKHLARRASF
jgi:hypothetical protein